MPYHIIIICIYSFFSPLPLSALFPSIPPPRRRLGIDKKQPRSSTELHPSLFPTIWIWNGVCFDKLGAVSLVLNLSYKHPEYFPIFSLRYMYMCPQYFLQSTFTVHNAYNHHQADYSYSPFVT
ncbi:hypothetical protein J3F84DRAFT_110505 [Trichoderma pleuroticola]